jgi:hypothetical protein
MEAVLFFASLAERKKESCRGMTLSVVQRANDGAPLDSNKIESYAEDDINHDQQETLIPVGLSVS